MEEEKLDVETQSRVIENGAVFDQKPRRYERSRDPRFARKVNFFHQFRALVSDPIALCDSIHSNCFVHTCMIAKLERFLRIQILEPGEGGREGRGGGRERERERS